MREASFKFLQIFHIPKKSPGTKGDETDPQDFQNLAHQK
jgi:hypothetical protein